MSQEIDRATDGGARRQFHNAAPKGLSVMPTISEVRREFGRRIQRIITEKGWNQSELSKQATKFMPGKRPLTRDNVSKYVRGQQIPGPVRMRALCKALGVEPEDLVPIGAVQSVDDDAPPLRVDTLADGRVFLRLNQVTDMDIAMKIMALLQSRDTK